MRRAWRPAAVRSCARCARVSCSGRSVSNAHCGPVPGARTLPAAAAAAPSPSATACLRSAAASKHARCSPAGARMRTTARSRRGAGAPRVLRTARGPKGRAAEQGRSKSARQAWAARGCCPGADRHAQSLEVKQEERWSEPRGVRRESVCTSTAQACVPKRKAIWPTASVSASATARGARPAARSASASSTCAAKQAMAGATREHAADMFRAASVDACGAPGSHPPTAW
jgi:hypothetical protein